MMFQLGEWVVCLEVALSLKTKSYVSFEVLKTIKGDRNGVLVELNLIEENAYDCLLLEAKTMVLNWPLDYSYQGSSMSLPSIGRDEIKKLEWKMM